MRTEHGPNAEFGRSAGRIGLVLLVSLMATGALLPAYAQRSSGVAQVAFAHGVAAFQQGHYKEAIPLFKEAVDNDPAEGTYLHWMAIAYLREGRGADAVELLEKSRKAERPPASGRWRVWSEQCRVKRSLERKEALPEFPEPAGLPKIRFPGDPPRWEGQVALASAYDSNPGLLAEDLGIPVSGVPLGDVPGDAAALLDLRIDHHPVWDHGGWSLGWSVLGHQSLHPDLDEMDLSVVQGTATLAWGKASDGFAEGPLGEARVPQGRGLTFLLQGGGLYGWLGGEDLLDSWEAAAAVARETDRTETRLGAAFLDRSYSGGASGALQRGREEEISVVVDQFLFFRGRSRYLRMGIRVGDVDADRTFAESLADVSIEAGLPLSSRWRLSLFSARREDDYDHPESNVGNPFGRPRDDTTWRVGATVRWETTKGLSWVAQATHIWRDSNVELPPGSPLLDYQRTLLSLGLHKVF